MRSPSGLVRRKCSISSKILSLTRVAASFAVGTRLSRYSRRCLTLLEFLITQRNRVVSKDDIIGAGIVSESALTTRINATRQKKGPGVVSTEALRDEVIIKRPSERVRGWGA